MHYKNEYEPKYEIYLIHSPYQTLVINGSNGFGQFIGIPDGRDLEIHKVAEKLEQMKDSIEFVLEMLKGE